MLRKSIYDFQDEFDCFCKDKANCNGCKYQLESVANNISCEILFMNDQLEEEIKKREDREADHVDYLHQEISELNEKIMNQDRLIASLNLNVAMLQNTNDALQNITDMQKMVIDHFSSIIGKV